MLESLVLTFTTESFVKSLCIIKIVCIFSISLLAILTIDNLSLTMVTIYKVKGDTTNNFKALN